MSDPETTSRENNSMKRPVVRLPKHYEAIGFSAKKSNKLGLSGANLRKVGLSCIELLGALENREAR